MCVFGTRPDAVKMAPIVGELSRQDERFDCRVVVTGQHREQLDQVLQAFDIRPELDLAIMQHGQTLTEITTRVLTGLDAALTSIMPDVVIGQGDTTTTFVAALSAFYQKVPFAHVEAGLRTDDPLNPFPEEMNRRLVGGIAAYHFAPTEAAKQNLIRENVSPDCIWITGNTGIDALLSVAAREHKADDSDVSCILSNPGRIVLITAHRRENWGEPMAAVCRAILQLHSDFPDCRFVFALHRNPVVREVVVPILSGHDRVILIEPPDYVPFVKLMQASTLILTDSGGVQEEAPSLGVPVLVLRSTTERPEGVQAGVAKLVGASEADIVREAAALLGNEAARREMAQAVNPYGDGSAAAQICRVLWEERKG